MSYHPPPGVSDPVELNVSLTPSPEAPPVQPDPHEIRRRTFVLWKPEQYGRTARAMLDLLFSDTTPVLCAMVASSDPQSFKEAVASSNKEEWLLAMQKEIDLLL